MLVDINLAFGTAKTYRLDRHQVAQEKYHLILQLIHAIQRNHHHLYSTRKIGDWQLERLADGANASNGVPAFVYKIKGRVFATDALLCAPKRVLHNQIRMLSLHILVVHV